MPTTRIVLFFSCIVSAATHAQPTTSRSDSDAFETLPETYIAATSNNTNWLLTPGSGVLVKQQDFLALGGSDFGDLVKYDPTVTAPYSFGSSDGTFGYGQSGYSGYSIRGIEGNRILMLVDGIRQPELFVSTSFAQDSNSSGGAGRDYYDPAMFEATEILKGSASALYGSDAMGGVVFFRTPNPDDFLSSTANAYAGLLRGQYFSHNDSFTGQGFFAFKQNNLSMLFGYAGRSGHETKNNGTVAPNPAESDSSSYLLKLQWAPDTEHAFGFTYENFSRDRFIHIQSANQFANIFDKQILNWESQARDRYSLSWTYTPEQSNWFDSVESQIYHQSTKNSSRNHSESIFGRIRDQNISFDTYIAGLQSTFRKQLNQHQLTYGIDLSKSSSENQFYRVDNGLPPFPNNISFAPSDTLRGAIFIQDQYSPSEHSPWLIISGLRLDYYKISPDLSADYLERINRISAGSTEVLPAEDHTQLSLAPRLDFIYKVNEQTSLYAQYSHGVRNPTAEEISMIFDHPSSGGISSGSITIPNPSLEEEKSHAFELGYKHQSQSTRLRASVFYTLYSDFIENGVFAGLTDEPTPRRILKTVNRGEVDIYGFELGGSWQLKQWFDKVKGIEVGFSTGRTWGVDRQRDAWLNTIEPWKSVAWIGYTVPSENFGIRLTGTYVGGVKHLDESNGGPYFRPPSYFTLDASGYWNINENLTIQAGINNILDEQYWQWGNTRRSGGHITNASAIDDRSTAPGLNGFLSLTYKF